MTRLKTKLGFKFYNSPRILIFLTSSVLYLGKERLAQACIWKYDMRILPGFTLLAEWRS